MRVKEVARCGHAVWSPAHVRDIHLACGTAAQQLDVAFSATPRLELFPLQLHETQMALASPVAALDTGVKFHSLSWGGVTGNGVIVGGIDEGELLVYSADQLFAGASQTSLLHRASRHTGSVNSLDFNPFQGNLLASGASESELYIWDLNKPAIPMSPGAKTTPLEPVSCVAWNRRVQHILGSTFSTRCVVWDLRKNEPIIKVSENQTGMKCRVLAWHPDVATQLVLASDQDTSPVIQLWDLRFATAPLRSLQRHNKGVLSLSWNQRDSHLLLSAGKDDRILCWDPHVESPEHQVVAEMCASSQWNFSVSWCPRSPTLAAGCSFDSRVAVYNVMGVADEPPSAPSAELADSFPDMSGVAAALPSVQRRVSVPLSRPPVWLKRPCGATFAFGGQLVTYCSAGLTKSGQDPTSVGDEHRLDGATVGVYSVSTEPELVQRCLQFQHVLENNEFESHCLARTSSLKAADTDAAPINGENNLGGASKEQGQEDESSRIWQFLEARLQSLHESGNTRLLQLLGHAVQSPKCDEVAAAGTLNGACDNAVCDESGADEALGGDGPIGDNASDSVLCTEPEELFDIPTGEDVDGQVSLALIRGDLSTAVEQCMRADRMADALLIALASPSQHLFLQTRAKYLDSMKTDMSRLIGALVTGDWQQVVSRCDPGSWREALAAVLTHAPAQQQAPLCSELGLRLQSQHTRAMWTAAQLCFVCAGDTDRLVQCWQSTRSDTRCPLALQELVEQSLTLEHVNRLSGGVASCSMTTSGGLRRKLVEYCQLITAQGCLQPVLEYLNSLADCPEADGLSQRVKMALSVPVSGAATYNTPRTNRNYSGPALGISPSPNLQRASATPLSAPISGSGAAPFIPAVGSAGTSPISVMPPAPVGSSVSPMIPAQLSPAMQPGSSPAPPLVPPAAVLPPVLPSAAAPGNGGGYRLGGRRQYVADPSTSSVGSNYSMSAGSYGSSASNVTNQPFYGGAYPGANTALSAPPPMLTPNQPGIDSSMGAVSPYGEVSAAALLPPRTSSGPGWNDPPPLRTSRKTGTVSSSLLQPVTQPIYNPAEMAATLSPVHAMAGSSAQFAGNFQPPNSGAVSGPMTSETTGSNLATSNPNLAPQIQPPQQQQQQVISAPKAAIPEQDAAIEREYERVRVMCAELAGSQPTRRKLDDVARKLDTLYDRLREQRVAANTLAGLHQIAALMAQNEFNAALSVLQQTVACSNFSDISGYMPSVKSLLQLAVQLQVAQQAM